MQSIRASGQAHPDQVPQLLAYNPSYVFFRRAPVTDLSVGPQGGQGVPLTPGASVAIDRHVWVYGTPFFVSVSQHDRICTSTARSSLRIRAVRSAASSASTTSGAPETRPVKMPDDKKAP